MARISQSKSDWRSLAERFGKLVPRAQLHPAALAMADGRRKSEVWAIAFSGGADSLALLLLMWAHWPERRGQLVALHFNHRLRGRESNADEAFCRKVGAALGVSVKVGRWSGSHRNASEAEARVARHHFFAQEMKAVRSKLLWLAHQQDDIAETMLMRLARGSGAGGLAAPRPVHPMEDGRLHLRPLLTLSKTALMQALKAAGANWREDSTNATGAYFRNRVRQSVLPAWEKAAGRDVVAGAARSRELLEEDEAALDFWAARYFSGRGRELDVAALAGLPRGLTRRVLHRWLLKVKPDTDLSRQGFEALLAALMAGKSTRFSVGRKHFAVIKEGRMTLKRG